VNLTLVEDGQEFDPLLLDFARDFKLVDASAYALRSELVLNRKR
jgi:hypothetical protein